MPVELRKRKAPTVPAPPPPAKRASRAKKEAPSAATNPASRNGGAATNATRASKRSSGSPKAGVAAATTATTPASAPSAGDTISLADFGGEVQTQDDETVTLKSLLTQSKTGVVLFTYPRASTPGCTRQACLFRDNYTTLSNAGLGVYGLSSDSPKANTTFKTKQKLPYRLLCDPSFSLIGAIGLKKNPKGTVRGVFLVNKNGKVLIAQPGGPADTLDVVVKLVQEGGLGSEALEENLELEPTNGNAAASDGTKNGKEDDEDEKNGDGKSKEKKTESTNEKPADEPKSQPQSETENVEGKPQEEAKSESKGSSANDNANNQSAENRNGETESNGTKLDKEAPGTGKPAAKPDETTATSENDGVKPTDEVKTTTEATVTE
ncbi:Peroxiredoxin DOT5 [Ceratocystis platani]|uniref:thioredoxin-dependent peroxiredoxin n=1 Tax=Ceratocystis fimbriata f. sp. platani TaxID=88771 RepID=A0A0F8DMJ1_CERFI|nr:Peroxiredoxin DOT5 [Ceratocystis platani]